MTLGDLSFAPTLLDAENQSPEDHTFPHGLWIGMAPALPSGTLEDDLSWEKIPWDEWKMYGPMRKNGGFF